MLLRTDILQKTVAGCPCFRTSLFLAHTRTQTMTDFRYKHNEALTSDLDIISNTSIGIFCPVASDQSDSERQRVTRKDRKKLRIPLQSIFAAQFCVWIFVFYLVSLDLDVEHNLTFLHNCHVLHRRFDSHHFAIRFTASRKYNATCHEAKCSLFLYIVDVLKGKPVRSRSMVKIIAA